MFNFKFVLPPIALMLLLTYAFFEFPRLGDFEFHSTYRGGGSYPSAVAFLVNLLPMPQDLGVFILALLVSVVLPYIAIFEITKNQMASWVYIFGSNIPTMLVSLYFVPQAMIQLLMLLSIAYPFFFIVFLFVGTSIHNSWFGGFVLALGFFLWKRVFFQ